MAQVTLFGKEAEEVEKKRKPDKVEIRVEPGQHYDESHKGGAEYTGVSCMGRDYGGSGGRDTDEEIEQAIKHYKAWIIREGDIPVVKDLRVVTQL